MGKVSIVIPMYNNEKYVEKCMESVLRQTYRDIEIIVVDDGSTDLSGKILDLFSQADERVRVFHQENAGVAAARNRGIDVATGEYLTFIDGDDYVGATYIADFVKCAKQKQADMVVCGFCMTDTDGNVIQKVIPTDYVRGVKEEWLFRISAVCSHFYRKQLWDMYEVRFYPGVRGEDMPISLFFSVACDRIAVLPRAEYFYLQHESSARHNFRGLKKYDLPLYALEQTICKLQTIGLKNNREFYELFVLRILATCYFELSPGAVRKKKKQLCDFVIYILEKYFPNYYKNSKARLLAPIDVPFRQKVAVRILIWLVRTRLLYPFSSLLMR